MIPAIKAAPAPRPQVYFFATCVIDLFSPEAGLDAITVLEHAGFDVLFPEQQTCCGQPAYTSGFPEQARAVMQAQLDLFPEPIPIVVPSGSCMGMIRHHWPQLCGEDAELRQRAEAVAARVVEFTDFIVGRIDLASLKTVERSVCLHTSCSARRESGALSSGRKLLASMPGVTLLIQDHESECCGFGGTFSVKHPEISAAMASDKTNALVASGCDAFVSADCGCLLNLNSTLQKRGSPLRGQHLASLLRASLPDEAVS